MAGKWNTALCPKLIAHMAAGGSFEAFGGIAEVTKKTLFSWVDEHPEWAEAKAIGELKALEYWEALGLGAITGQVKNFQQASWIFTMKCRFRKFGYRDYGGSERDDDDSDTASDISSIPTAQLLKFAKK